MHHPEKLLDFRRRAGREPHSSAKIKIIKMNSFLKKAKMNLGANTNMH